MNEYLLQNLIALDQQLNTLLNGKADETLSSRAWRTDQNKKLFGQFFRPVIDFIMRPFGKDHCYNAYLAEVERRQLPSQFKYL